MYSEIILTSLVFLLQVLITYSLSESKCNFNLAVIASAGEKNSSGDAESKVKTEGSDHIEYNKNEYFVFIANLDSDEIQMHWLSAGQMPYSSLGAVLKAPQLASKKVLMATNAGMFNPKQAPQGLYVEKGKVLVPLDSSKGLGNFYLKPNGIFYIDANNEAHIDTTETIGRNNLRLKYATQSGPMLVINGIIHPGFNKSSVNKKIRSGVGIINSKRVVFVISMKEVTFYDFARVFKELYHCNNALFLDGAISEMYLADLNPEQKGGQFGAIITVEKK